MFPKSVKFPGFDRLSGSVFLHEAAAPSKVTILLCTWHNAGPKLVGKYAARYLELFPDYTILLLAGDAAGMFVSQSRATRTVKPAVDILEQRQAQTILAAAYSNGGAISLTTVANGYRTRTGRPLPVKRIICDSTPGTSDFAPNFYAFRLFFRPLLAKYPFLYWPIWLGVWISMQIYVLLTVISGGINPLDQLRIDLKDKQLLEKSPRTFFYSRADQVIPYDAIVKYQRDLKADGWDVRQEEFSGTQHVAHAAGDPDRYWKVVEETFDLN